MYSLFSRLAVIYSEVGNHHKAVECIQNALDKTKQLQGSTRDKAQ